MFYVTSRSKNAFIFVNASPKLLDVATLNFAGVQVT